MFGQALIKTSNAPQHSHEMTSISKKVLYTIVVIAGIFFVATSLPDSFGQNSLRDAPAYSTTTLDGTAVSLDDLKGSVVMINVWATWCEPCREEMPALQELQNKFSDSDFNVIGVSIDEKGSTQMIRQFLDSENISYTIWHDPEDKFQFAFRTIGVPETILINKEGKILYQWRGAFDPLSENTIYRVESALANTEFVGNDSISIGENIIASSAISFSAGLLSFLSPCVLPLIPVYASFVTGMSIKEMSNKNNNLNTKQLRLTATKRGLLFVFGFSTIFILLGSTVAFAGSVFLDASQWIERIGGIVLIILGLHLLGVFRIPWLERQIKFDVSKRSSGKAGTFFVGMAFGAGWTPCIGPILAGILTIAASSSSVTSGALLLSIYSAGLAIPFLISALAIDRFLSFSSLIKNKLIWIERISGMLFVGIGIVLLTGSLTLLSDVFNTSFGFDPNTDVGFGG